MEVKEIYMQRALQLARNGEGSASPNPMVGAVIVDPFGRVIGEGWHRRCGEGHAEVNAVASVSEAARPLLAQSTMYVTLEPCSHYGKTPPCAELILRTGIPRVVVATGDPNPKVSGRGIAMLRNAGVEVEVGLLGEEARALNRRFFLSQILRRPWITLKWARSADGFMDHRRTPANPSPCRFSNPLTTLSTMRLRALHDGILTTSATVAADDCRLTLRSWAGKAPRPIILDPHSRLTGAEAIFAAAKAAKVGQSDESDGSDGSDAGRTSTSALSSSCGCGGGGGVGEALPPIVASEQHPIVVTECDFENLLPVFQELYTSHGITSVLVEAGPRLLSALIAQNLWDAAREEVATLLTLGDLGTHPAPQLPAPLITATETVDSSLLRWYLNH